MSMINSFLHKCRARENQFGVILVVLAYVLSAVLLFLGSDSFNDTISRAEKINSSSYEVTKDATNKTTEEATNQQKTQGNNASDSSSGTTKQGIINPYGIPELQPLATENHAQYTDDTYWLMGYAMNSEEYDAMLMMLDDAKVFEEEENAIESFSVISNSKSIAISVTKEEVAMLERIVEAEASGEDLIGRILVANVIFNRIKDDEFPDTVKEVIFQKVGDDYQFSPIADKRYWSVEVSKETKEAVQKAIEGEDYSQGALYFMARKKTRKNSAKWFDNNLEWLFRHGGHEFFKG